MLAFFKTDLGRNILALRGLATEWAAVEPNPFALHVQNSLKTLLGAYYEACDIMPEIIGPDPANRAFVAKGPSKEMRLAYYVVESDRLSRNPAVTRVLLTAADTLLEFGADNAGLFISNPRSRALVESLLTEFAVKRDWDDAGGAEIFKTLLGSAAVAVLENPTSCPDHPVAQSLFAALADIQKKEGADFAAKLVTRDGFRALIARCLVQTADQPGLLPESNPPVLQNTLRAMLLTAGNNLTGILEQPRALSGVIEAGIAASAQSALPLLDQKVADQPLLAAVLKSTLAQTRQSAAANQLFAQLADGDFFAALFRTTLQTVAATPDALASQANLDQRISTLIAACADELSQAPLSQAFTPHTLRVLATRTLNTLANDPSFLASRGEFTAKVASAALASAAQALQNGFTADDLAEISDTVVRTAAAHLNLVQMDDSLRVVVSALAQTLNAEGLSTVTTPTGRKSLFFAALQAFSNNPPIWRDFAGKDLAQPLVAQIVSAFATNPRGLLSGPALVPAFQTALEATARRGRSLLEEKTGPDALQKILVAALASAERAIGDTIDAVTLPQYLRRVVLAFLTAPFDPDAKPDLADWLNQQLPVAA